MDKKELIFPGIVLGLVLVIALGLILTQKDEIMPIRTPQAVTSTSTTGTTTVSAETPALSPDSVGSASGSAGAGHASWDSSEPANYYPYGTVTLSFGQAAGFKDGLSIRPLTLMQDSRCPIDVQCIQAGTVRISLKTNTGETTDIRTISLNDRITVGGDTIIFASVEPARMRDNAPAESAYRLAFVVEPAEGSGSASSDQCYVGGCSSELCTDNPTQASPCIYKPEFACYRKATCERQADGACGWTQTAELSACLADA